MSDIEADSLFLALERFKNGDETTDDLQLIRTAFNSRQIDIIPSHDSTRIVPIRRFIRRVDVGESNEIRLSGSVNGTQIIEVTSEQVFEILNLPREEDIHYYEIKLPNSKTWWAGIAKSSYFLPFVSIVNIIIFYVSKKLISVGWELEKLNSLIDKLSEIQPGGSGKDYEECIFDLLIIFFSDQLSHPKRESSTKDQTERRDIIFFNKSNHEFWALIRQQHQARDIVFECKNKKTLGHTDIPQLESYLGEPLGNFGVIVTRSKPGKNSLDKVNTAYNRNKKVILIISDEDIIEMAKLKINGKDPTKVLNDKYVDLIRANQ